MTADLLSGVGEMAYGLTGRRIILVSPQPWDHLPISKHHYAEVLGQKNKVFFLEPPDPALKRGARRRREVGVKGVEVVSWAPWTPRRLRFHLPALYRGLIGFDLRQLGRWLGGGIDLVWCFDFNSFPDLRAFGAEAAVFHPVDPLSTAAHYRIGRSADLILSVSDPILQGFRTPGIHAPLAVVNHGIGPAFAALARGELRAEKPRGAGDGVQIGYFGNLDRRMINVDLLAEVVAAHPAVTFHFWGPCDPEGPLAGQVGILPNSRFHGPVSKDALVRAAAAMDGFWLAYKDDPTESDRSNSHKLLEYFATGKPVISTRMSCYDDDPDLVLMSRAPGDRDFPALFTRAIAEIDHHNAAHKADKRQALALRFTYEANVARIDTLLGAALGADSLRKDPSS